MKCDYNFKEEHKAGRGVHLAIVLLLAQSYLVTVNRDAELKIQKGEKVKAMERESRFPS